MSTRSLKRDTEGAVVVMTIFASAFLIGAMWYLLGVGDALLYKERMQDGADAIAFAPAVVHARGMNLIALLNLTMAAVLSVLVAVKIFQVLLAAATVAACLAYNYQDCAYLGKKNKPYADFVKKYEKKVTEINEALHDTADTVAKAAPILGARRGVESGKPYATLVEGGFSASISVIPGSSERGFGGSLADSSGGGSGRERLGLPVEDDDFKNLCKHSGTLLEVVLVPTIMNFDDGPKTVMTTLKWVGWMVPGLVAANPSMFCGKGSKKAVSKRIYGPAQHGNDYFATWGFTESSFIEKTDRGDKGLEVATWQQRAAGTEMSNDELDRRMRTVQVAKSEFYFDPRRGGPRQWSGLKEEALWHLRWRARLRRVSQPNRTLASFFTGSGMGPIMGANSGSGADIPGIMRTVLAASPEQLAGWSDKNLGNVQQTRRTGGIVH
jgi:hypothetical protein